LPLIRRLRIPALFCGLAVLLCELISRPYTTMGVCDDGPYIFMARTLANTGHFAYNGWATAMIGWQLYLGAAFIKLFGFSFTTVRMSTLLVAVVLAWLLQRTLVLAGISERNATIGTLALVLSPLYLMLSVTFMSEITGLFAVVICLYGCLRALRSSTDRAIIGWLYFSILANALCGTSRQIAWLGILVMVPSALWLLRERRRVFIAGTVGTLAGALFILACMHWFSLQPYTLPEHLTVHRGEEFDVLSSYFHAFLELPFLLLPMVILFIPEIWRSLRRSIKVASVASVIYAVVLLALQWRHTYMVQPLLEPTIGDWVTKYGIYGSIFMVGAPPIFLHTGLRVVLTIASLGGLLGLIISLVSNRKVLPGNALHIRWQQLGTLLAPFAIVYSLLLIPRAASGGIFDRYLLELLVVALICVTRYYQEQIQPRLPVSSHLVVAIVAVYGVACIHDMFALYRARIVLESEVGAAGVSDTSVDYGWEYDLGVELQLSNHINDARIVLPAHAYVPRLVAPDPNCPASPYSFEKIPHIHPLYAVSFDPTACYGPAPFAPVHYSRWPYRTPGTLYVVRYVPPAKP
jgi:hypothetical protein